MLPSSLLLFLNALLSLSQLANAEQIRLTSENEAASHLRLSDQVHESIWTPEDHGRIRLPPHVGNINSRPTLLYRPRSLEVLHRNRLRSLRYAESDAEPVIWDPVEVEGPDVDDLHTLAQLARMAGNAYALPGHSNWYDVDPAWNRSFPFGWEESDGFRGHVFLSSDNSTIVLSIKGTTLQGPTSKLDKFNDNLLFSCCCARVDISWVFRTVCGCYSGNFKCDSQCLTNALIEDSLFYSIGVKLIDDLRKIYPASNLWLVGHSLGGSLASLLGATYGLPAVAFEAPGERLAATRLHLPLPPPMSSPSLPSPPALPSPSIPKAKSTSKFKWHLPRPKLRFPFPGKHTSQPSIPIPTQPPPPPAQPRVPTHHIATTHVYHNADPIPQGTCTGIGSPCAQAGYALETRCHLGKSIVFDSVHKLGWGVDVRKHVIRQVITKVLEADGVCWGDDDSDDKEDDDGNDDVLSKGRKKGKHGEKEPVECTKYVPKRDYERDCVDCFKWEFGDFKKDK
ncbi:hypothetical protein D9613_002632 [Agrocybe pediades]|uniref:triacylglycerol lipase n=1 Tax=Agrocybe pediades TaxID=84607 RepID=A0A8H4QQV0_9AGAR|nr:hypothetical protein D9613_002632 [Agrocybe pediades]